MLLVKPRAAAVAAGRAALPHSHEHRSVPDYVRRAGNAACPGRTGTCVSVLSPKGPRSWSCSPNVVPVMMRSAASQRGIRWTPGGIAAAGRAPAAARVLLVSAGGWLARHHLGPGREPRLETARDAARGRLLALGAGLLAAGALAFTERNIALSRRGRLTGCYAKAVEQLGSAELTCASAASTH